MIYFLIIAVLLNIVEYNHAVCPDGSFQGLKSDDCYMFSPTRLEYIYAKDACISYNGGFANGGQLTSIHDEATNKFLGEQLTKLDKSTNKMVWIGGHTKGTCSGFNCTTKGPLSGLEWVWEDDTKFDFKAFSEEQHINKSAYYFDAAFNISDNLWYAIDTDENFPYLCKVPVVAPPGPTSAPCGSNGTFPGLYSNDCFKYYNVSVSLGEAEYTCNTIFNSENDNMGYLASIHDAFTNALVQHHLSTLTDEMVWFGGQTYQECNLHNCEPYEWGWSDQSAFDYNNFANGYPNAAQNEIFMFNSKDGQWYTQSNPSGKHTFVCKIQMP